MINATPAVPGRPRGCARPGSIWTVVAILLMLAPLQADAQHASVEVFGGGALWWPNQRGVYHAPYTPSRVVGINQLFGEPDPRSAAQQTLELDAEPGVAVAAGVNIHLDRGWGIQFMVEHAPVPLTGENSPHMVHLEYTTVNFPFPDFVDRSIDVSLPWPETDGTLTSMAVHVNAVRRFPLGERVEGSVSGGVTYVRVRGEAEPVGAFAAWEGGHAVLFWEVYEMSLSSAGAGTVGGNIGGGVDVALSTHLKFFGDVRVMLTPPVEAAVRFDRIVSDNVVTVPVQEIEDFVMPPPIELDPSAARLLLGLKWVF